MPYTVGLLGSVPRLDAPQGTRLIPIPGAPPDLSSLAPDACPFAPRCPLVIDECRSAEPDLVTVRDGHRAACIRTDDVAGRSAAEIFGVTTQPSAIDSRGGRKRSGAAGRRSQPRPTRSPRASCCAGGWARYERSTASASPWSRAARWASSANRVRANPLRCTRYLELAAPQVGFHRDSRRRRRQLESRSTARAAARAAGRVSGPGGVARPPPTGVRGHR